MLAATLALPAAAAAQQGDADARALIEVADIGALSASPDGSRVAFRVDRPSIERNGYALGWWVVDLATGQGREVPGAGEPILVDPGLLVAEAPIWSPDGKWIYFRALSRGAVQIWRSAADGSGAEPVTHEPGDVLAMSASADGRAISLRVGPPRAEIEQAELQEYESGILLDEHVELAHNVFRGALINGRRATQRLTGGWFNRGTLLASRPPRWRRLDLATLAIQESAADVPTAAPAAAGLSARSERGDVATARWDGGAGDLTVSRPGGGPPALACPLAECRSDRIAWMAWRPGHDQLLLATADRALRQTVRLWDLRAGSVRTILAGDGLLNGGRSDGSPCAVTARRAVCVRADPVGPPRLVAVDLATGAERLLHDPNAEYRSWPVPAVERLAWRDADGGAHTGVLLVPPRTDARPVPLLINYYRCSGFLRGGVGDEWPFAALAARGIAALCINTARVSGSQDAVGQYEAALRGIRASIELLAARGLVDRSRIGMGGLSFGSEVTQWVMMHSDLIAAASIATPQVEPITYWLNNVRGRDHHLILRQVWGLGSPEETPERWRQISPALNVERITAPLLLQLSEQEARYAAEFYAKLSRSPTPTELYIFPDEPHIKVQPRHRLAIYTRNIDWFRFWLQDHVDPDPAKADQYRRWRALAERQASAQPPQDRSQSSSETRSSNR